MSRRFNTNQRKSTKGIDALTFIGAIGVMIISAHTCLHQCLPKYRGFVDRYIPKNQEISANVSTNYYRNLIPVQEGRD